MCIFRSTKAKQQASHCAVCLCVSTKAEQQASNREAPPEHVEVERQKPERGLTKVVEQCGAKRHVARTKGSATLERGTQKT